MVDLTPYEYLWTTEKNDWVLLTDEESETERDYMPYHIKSWRFLYLDDPVLYRAVVDKMIEAGIPRVTDEDIFGKS